MEQIEIGLIILFLLFVFAGIPILIICCNNRTKQTDVNEAFI